MAINDWWATDSEETFWMEITDRSDLGVDLHAPQTKDDGTDYWSYSLVQHVQDQDLLLHYWKPEEAIVGYSRAAGEAFAADTVWGARGHQRPPARYRALSSARLVAHARGLHRASTYAPPRSGSSKGSRRDACP